MASGSPHLYVILLAFLCFSAYAVSRYAQFLTAGYDLGIFDQVVRAYANFDAPISPLKGDNFNIFADHFHPILVTLAPLYWLWDDPRMLLIAQAFLVCVSGYFVWKYARRYLSEGWATTALAGYLFGWPIQGLIDFDFHEIAFALPILAWMLDAFDRENDHELFVGALLLLAVREDMGAVVFMFGLLRAIKRRARWPGFVLMALGVVAFVVIVGVIIPGVAADRQYAYWDYAQLGANPGEVLHSLVANPLHALVLFFTPGAKTLTLIALFAPVLFLPLVSPLTVIALPILMERFWSDRVYLWTTEFHYNAPIWVVFFIAALGVLARIRKSGRTRSVTTAIAGIALLPLLATTLLASHASNLFPLGRMLTGEAWTTTSHMKDQAHAVASIPPMTCVAADDRLVPHLTRTNSVTVPGVSTRRMDYYLLDFSQQKPATTEADWTTESTYYRAIDAGYTIRNRFGSIVVLQAPASREASGPCSPTD